MSSEKCIHGCRPPYNLRGPCPQCKEWHAEKMDDFYWEIQTQKADRAIRQYISATDEEWRRHLDDVAPVVDQSDSFTFTYLI